ncbi:MAG TPA: amidohydrolase family protein [Nitrososphaeraceae archaeon]|jgi:imidazolonepropionase-like amidohydrolase|nr:amidohydrolase family protein [Nitrososphaeraceae archaeon]HZB99004.1 amidohydrolase family protein [Nitrososphaeraceae archaeon]
MKVIKSRLLFDGVDEKRDYFIGFENDEIKYVGNSQPKESSEIIAEGAVVTPAFIDSHSHIGMVRSGEPDKEEEANEHMNSVYPLVNALHSIYMDDPSFKESVESGVLYSTVLPGSGNIIAGNAVLIRNFVQDIGQAHIMDVGIKAALGYNPRSTVDWKGNRPSTRMGAVAILRENFIKARKMQKLLETEKKVIDEVEPLTELFMDILSNRFKMMVHVHKEDDIMVLIQLIKEFGIKVIANHCVDVHREEVFTALKASSIPVIYGPMDSFPYKVELKHESWRNAEKLLNSGAKFSIMSDHPVILQRNILYSLRHLLRFGLSKADAISKISKEAAEIIGAQNIGQVRAGFKASIVVWNGDPFSLSSYPILVIAEGRTVYEEE